MNITTVVTEKFDDFMLKIYDISVFKGGRLLSEIYIRHCSDSLTCTSSIFLPLVHQRSRLAGSLSVSDRISEGSVITAPCGISSYRCVSSAVVRQASPSS